MKALLEVRDVTLQGEGQFALRGISFSQEKGEKLALSGETGAGKSSVLKLIAGLLQPDAGTILFEGKKVTGPADQLVPGHPGIAYLSQQFELQKSLRVEQVLDYANTLSGGQAGRLYRVCQIDHLLTRRTDQLSGGEKQRVAICRLLTSSPRLLLLDEPFSHLDMVHKATLKEVIADIGNKLGITCLLVSHDPLDSLSWADRIIVMKDGKLVQADRPETIYNKPVNEYVGGLFGKYNLIKPKQYKLFSKLTALKRHRKNGKNATFFLRPEHFKLVPKSADAVRGTVRKILFFGSYRELLIKVGDETVSVRTTSTIIAEGDALWLTVSLRNLWPLPE